MTDTVESDSDIPESEDVVETISDTVYYSSEHDCEEVICSKFLRGVSTQFYKNLDWDYRKLTVKL